MTSTTTSHASVLAAQGSEYVAAELRRVPGLEVVEAGNEEELLAQIDKLDIVVLMNQAYSARIAGALQRPTCRVHLLQLLTAGYDLLAVHGVPSHVKVATAGPSRSSAVAEHAMALLLAWVRCLPQALEAQSARRWSNDFRSGLTTLRNATVLIVGFGSIGQEIAVRARAFGAQVEGVTRTGSPHALAHRMHTPDQLDAALATADAVIVATPSTAQTRGMFGAGQFSAMKRSALFINVARGDVLDTAALESALVGGDIRAAALDVVDQEPLPGSRSLWTLPNLLITPHVGGLSGAAGHQLLAQFVAQNVARAQMGSDPFYTVPGTLLQPS